MLYSHHVLSTPFTCANVCILGSVEASSTQCTPKAAAVHSERHRTTLLMPAQCTGIDNGGVIFLEEKRKSRKVWRFQDKVVFLQTKGTIMQGTLSLNTILSMLSPLSMSNKKWLADRLYEQVKQSKELVFPTIPKDFKVSKEVEELSFGAVPKGVDIDEEMKNIWEKMAQ